MQLRETSHRVKSTLTLKHKTSFSPVWTECVFIAWSSSLPQKTGRLLPHPGGASSLSSNRWRSASSRSWTLPLRDDASKGGAPTWAGAGTPEGSRGDVAQRIQNCSLCENFAAAEVKLQDKKTFSKLYVESKIGKVWAMCRIRFDWCFMSQWKTPLRADLRETWFYRQEATHRPLSTADDAFPAAAGNPAVNVQVVKEQDPRLLPLTHRQRRPFVLHAWKVFICFTFLSEDLKSKTRFSRLDQSWEKLNWDRPALHHLVLTVCPGEWRSAAEQHTLLLCHWFSLKRCFLASVALKWLSPDLICIQCSHVYTSVKMCRNITQSCSPVTAAVGTGSRSEPELQDSGSSLRKRPEWSRFK